MDKIVFLDRDGVINEFPGNGKYVTRVKDFHFIPGSLEAIRTLTKEGYAIFVVSNQAGVSKGIFTKDKLEQITDKMLQGVKKTGGEIKKVFYSTSRSGENCEFRKPNIGSVRMALRSMNKTIRAAKNAFFVGDTEIDIKAGHNAGCKTIFVLSGREDHDYLARKWEVRPDYIARDLLGASKIICRFYNKNGEIKPLKIKIRKKKKTAVIGALVKEVVRKKVIIKGKLTPPIEANVTTQ